MQDYIKFRNSFINLFILLTTLIIFNLFVMEVLNKRIETNKNNVDVAFNKINELDTKITTNVNMNPDLTELYKEKYQYQNSFLYDFYKFYSVFRAYLSIADILNYMDTLAKRYDLYINIKKSEDENLSFTKMIKKFSFDVEIQGNYYDILRLFKDISDIRRKIFMKKLYKVERLKKSFAIKKATDNSVSLKAKLFSFYTIDNRKVRHFIDNSDKYNRDITTKFDKFISTFNREHRSVYEKFEKMSNNKRLLAFLNDYEIDIKRDFIQNIFRYKGELIDKNAKVKLNAKIKAIYEKRGRLIVILSIDGIEKEYQIGDKLLNGIFEITDIEIDKIKVKNIYSNKVTTIKI